MGHTLGNMQSYFVAFENKDTVVYLLYPPAPQAFLPFIANHTLNGEICRDFSRGNVDVKVSTFVLNEQEGWRRMSGVMQTLSLCT